jgi:hypothetical protein
MGAVHKDNVSALPLGLMGMYEEASPPASNIKEREKFLELFSVWALLKKEVSAQFVLHLLHGWTEEQVIAYITQYSKWFNSPVSGRYALYHDRLRTFILQKVSYTHHTKGNNAIIKHCQLALQTKAGDEWERYALEFLSEHLLAEGMISGNCKNLIDFSRSSEIWRRQIELSAGMEWSKKAIYNLIDLNSKYNPFDCQIDYLNLLKLSRDSRDYIKYFNKIEIKDLSKLEILRLQNAVIEDEYDGQFLYVSVIIKIHRCIKSGLSKKEISSLIDELDKILLNLQAIDHGRLNFHDVIPLRYFEDIFEYYKSEVKNYKNLLAMQYEFPEFLSGDLNSSSNLNEFILKNQTLDCWIQPMPWQINKNIDELIDVICSCFIGVDLSQIESLDELYVVVENEELYDVPISILIVPILFRKEFCTNRYYKNIKTAWIEEFMDVLYFHTATMAYSMLRSLSDEKCDKVEINNQIKWIATNELSADKFDFDLFIGFVSEFKYLKDGSLVFEQWLLDALFNRTNSTVRAIIDDQKVQVIRDFCFDSKMEYERMIREYISPFSINEYLTIFNEGDQSDIANEEISNLSNTDFLKHDFGSNSEISPVSVKNVTWLSVLPRLQNIDSNILYTTMHKIFLNKLCYQKKNGYHLPCDTMTFFDFNWLNSLLNNETSDY